MKNNLFSMLHPLFQTDIKKCSKNSLRLSDMNAFISKPQISCTLRMHPMNLEERRALFSHYGRFSTINPKVCL